MLYSLDTLTQQQNKSVTKKIENKYVNFSQ